jgi:hypothetical protein
MAAAQFIAAYAPNPPFAALLIPVVIAVLVTFSGVLVSDLTRSATAIVVMIARLIGCQIPYSQLTVFWRYWCQFI